jgi:hypothetical protein
VKHRWISEPDPTRAVIIVTYEGSPWIDEQLECLRATPYPVVLAINTADDNRFDPAGLYLAVALGLEEFVLLHDSCLVRDVSVFDLLFATPGVVALSPDFRMLQGKFVTNRLPRLPDPPIGSKWEAVAFEVELSKRPADVTLFPEFHDDNSRFGRKHGRDNLIIENEYLTKYKQCYDVDLVEQHYPAITESDVAIRERLRALSGRPSSEASSDAEAGSRE